MDSNVEQNHEIEEGTAPEVTAAKPRGRKPKVETVAPNRDRGEWKYKPWKGLDHWVHERTGASTFDLKNIK